MASGNSRPRNRHLPRKSYMTALKLAVATFFVTIAVTLPSQQAVAGFNLFVSLAVIVLIILIGVIFDILGVAVAVADEAPFHAMSAKKVRGSKQALRLIKNADAVAGFSNDLVGDIAGTVSGAASAGLVFRLALVNPNINQTIAGIVAVGLAAALTVGGKAAGKRLAITRATPIVLRAGKILYTLERVLRLRAPDANSKPKPASKRR